MVSDVCGVMGFGLDFEKKSTGPMLDSVGIAKGTA